MRAFCMFTSLAGLLAVGCYSPEYPDGRQCAPDASCPGDLVCDLNFVCMSPELVEGRPDPPLPTFSGYGALCWPDNPCDEGLYCFVDPNDPADPDGNTNLGMCTAMCGDGTGNIDEQVCQFIDPGSVFTQCLFTESPDLSPMYCGTPCNFGDAFCPEGLECREDAWLGVTMCKPPLG